MGEHVVSSARVDARAPNQPTAPAEPSRPIRTLGFVPALDGIRAVAVLEHVASPAARQLVQALVEGAPAAHITREARTTLERLRLAARE